jgi:hypothetical protein
MKIAYKGGKKMEDFSKCRSCKVRKVCKIPDIIIYLQKQAEINFGVVVGNIPIEECDNWQKED